MAKMAPSVLLVCVCVVSENVVGRVKITFSKLSGIKSVLEEVEDGQDGIEFSLVLELSFLRRDFPWTRDHIQLRV